MPPVMSLRLDWAASSFFLMAELMAAMTRSSSYALNLLLKQGYYDYIYAVKENTQSVADVSVVAGDFWETKNEYTIYLYLFDPTQYYDQLIGVTTPNQILLALKKNLNQSELLTQNTTMKYQREFSQLGMEIANANSCNDWIEVYRHIVYWEMLLMK